MRLMTSLPEHWQVLGNTWLDRWLSFNPSFPVKISLTGLAFLMSGAVFLLLLPFLGLMSSVVILVPTLVSGLLFGFRGGFLGGLFGIAFNLLLFYFVVADDLILVFSRRALPGAMAMLLVGITIGTTKDLLKRVHQQALELQVAYKHLQQYADELKTINAELDAFSHTVAHDLKAPLTTIVGFSSLLNLRHSKMPAAQLERYLQSMTRSGQKMSCIIDELLLLANVRKIEDVPRVRLDTAKILNEVQLRLQHTIKDTQARISVLQVWPVAIGYAVWVEEVWANYISNAIKYGGRPPQIDLGADVLQNGMIRFWVQDNGQGLSPADQARLFTQFSRLHQVNVEGQGLGLSIVERIVHKLGGGVGVESKSGEGCLFYFTLPAAGNHGGFDSGDEQTSESVSELVLN